MNSEGKKEAFMHIAKSYEYLFPEMLDLAEQIYPNAKYKDDGIKKLSVFAVESNKYRTDELVKRGYVKEEHRKRGFGKAMLLHAQNLLFEDGIKYCFVNPFAEHRDRVYSSAGFETFDEEFIWTKKF